MSVRLTKAAWLLLQRLNQETAELAFCRDRRCGRTHFWLRGQAVDVVRESTLRVLHQGGLLREVTSATPTCRISDKGRQMLRERLTDAEFIEEIPQNFELRSAIRDEIAVSDKLKLMPKISHSMMPKVFGKSKTQERMENIRLSYTLKNERNHNE